MSSLSFPPTWAVGRGAAWYRGDCHVHSVHTDGELTPEELVGLARAAGLDFIATTEHNSGAAPGAWGHLAADDFLIVLGEEVTTKSGHWLALGLSPGQVVDWNHQVGDGLIDQCLDLVHRVGGLCVAAHPHAPYPSGDFMFPFGGFDVVEVWNGQIGIPHTVVFAEELSTEAVLAAIRSGRSWIAESADVEVAFTANVEGCVAGVGERLTTHGGQVEVQAAVQGVPSAAVGFHTDRGKVHRGGRSPDQ